jgi:capsid protein
MPTLVNQWGLPVSSRNFFRSSRRDPSARPYEPVDLRDIDDLLPAYDHAIILSASRRLFANSDIIQGAVKQKATWSIGKFWSPEYTGSDTIGGEAAKEWLIDWLEVSNVRGPTFAWQTALYLISVALDRDGEAFVLFTESPSGFPQLQLVPATRVGSRAIGHSMFGPQLIEDGPYRGLREVKGVALNPQGRAVAYRILGEDPDGSGDQFVSARDMRHIYDPDWVEQSRGIPAGQQSLNMMRDSLTSHEWEQQAMLAASATTVLEYNEHGGPDPNDPQILLGGEQGAGIVYEESGPHKRYFRSDSGSKLEAFASPRPGPEWDRFNDRIIRSYLVGMDWPFALAWKPEGMNSVIEHAELMKAERAVQDRQSVIEPHARAVLAWASARAMERGDIPRFEQWWKWSFSKPPRISVSFAKDGRELRAQFEEGHITETQMQGWQGRRLEDHLRERARDAAMRKRIAREISEETGEQIDPADMGSQYAPQQQPET